MDMTMVEPRRLADLAPAGSRRLLADPTIDWATHHRRRGPMPWQGAPGRLIGVIEAAGLTGRGGAGFPTARKLAALAKSGGVVIGNGAEGEPASGKDRLLLDTAPHLVLDGLQLAAEAVGAARAYLYVRPATASALRTLIAGRRAAGWDRAPVSVVEAPDTFIAGQESAVVARIEGRPAVPRDNLPGVTEVGVQGAPALVQNVETLAHLALVARYGPEWFRSQGTAAEPGTFLATIGGAVAAPGVYEAPYGIPLGDLIQLAGGATFDPQAILIGGYHGGWVPPNPDLPVSRAGLRAYGGSPGAGVVVVLPATTCGLVESARIAAYLARQSAGQCGPCVNGLPRLADTLNQLAQCKRDSRLPAEVSRLAGLVTSRGACRHPDGTARFVASSLHTFDAEVRASGRLLHHTHRQESTMTTRLHIDWTACHGRGSCVELLHEILASDDWGYPLPRDGTREPAIPDALDGHARRAVRDCPRLALQLTI